MKLFTVRRVLALGLLLLLLALGTVAWLAGSRWGQQQVARYVRQQLTRNSELELGPFEVEFSPWRDFPHLTASLHHLALTDTTGHRRVPVLRIGRADLRLELAELLRRRIRVTQLYLHGGEFQQLVDSTGHSWGLRGKRARRATPKAGPALGLVLDSVLIDDFRIITRNNYTRNAFTAHVRQGHLTAQLRQGVLHVRGRLHGQLVELRNRNGRLLNAEPVQAWVTYHYNLAQRQGRFSNTRATLNGDTVRISGTHTVAAGRQTGTILDLRFAGEQPLLEVLRTALPPPLRPYLRGAQSPSHAHIDYRLSGLSGPINRPRTLLSFSLRNARLHWPDSVRRISHWDMAGTLDTGPEHAPRSTTLTLPYCRLRTRAGQLDVTLRLHDFTHPTVQGRLRGRTELTELDALLAPRWWRAQRGQAELDLAFRGLVPVAMPRSGPAPAYDKLSVRGRLSLQQATLTLPVRHARVSGLNAQVRLWDGRWHLSNASGELDGMRFEAQATTDHLLSYLTGQRPKASISGFFAVDRLRVDRLRELLQPLPASARPASRPVAGGRAQPTAGRKQPVAPGHLIPPGLRLNVGLQCGLLILQADTLRNLAVRVRHDGRRVQLSGLTGQMWGGTVRGQAQWPSNPADRRIATHYRLELFVPTLDYRRLITRLSQPPQRVSQPAAVRRPQAGSTPAAVPPTLRELLLAANGQLSCAINTVNLPNGQHLRNLRLRVFKAGNVLRLPYLSFRDQQGGLGQARAIGIVRGLQLTSAAANVNLRYTTLDVQQFLQMVASLAPPARARPAASSTGARPVRPADRRSPTANAGQLINGVLSAVLQVQADQVRYAAVRGSRFRLVSHILPGEARLDECAMDAAQGHLTLRGRMRTDQGQDHHPLHVQLQLQHMQLAALFSTATAMRLQVLGGQNIRGSLQCAADLRTDLAGDFLPRLDRTRGYLKTELRDLELIEVDVLTQALRFLRDNRTRHLYFEPVNGEFFLDQGTVLIPNLRLNSSLSNLEVSGLYGLDGSANLYIGLNPWQALFGNNERRISRIQAGKSLWRKKTRLTYLNLRRPTPNDRYKVRLFKQGEQRRQQLDLRQQCRELLLTQRLDTTLRLLR